ncbi:MAG: hypothetical protein HOK97_06180 [Deltaproteobacteria bacterium]|nr:hypothetical protein [Deltaproteobacteria bacterium]MBT6489328.1 hypothetical protein [Deltaproteobacteria bacterium]
MPIKKPTPKLAPLGMASQATSNQGESPEIHRGTAPKLQPSDFETPPLPERQANISGHSLQQTTDSLNPKNIARPSTVELLELRQRADKQTIQDAKALYQCMKGLGTDEDGVYTILEKRSPAQRDAVEKEFDKRYGVQFGSLTSAIYGDFSGAELQRALDALHSGRPKAPPVGSQAFENLLDQTTDSKQRLNNSAQLLLDGTDSFAARRNLIRGATHSIYMQTFIFNDDATGWDLARELSLRAQEGIDVRVIYDGIGSLRAAPEMFDYMRENGVQVHEYGDPVNQFWDLNDRWHEKHLIVDQEVSIEGGMNIANEYALGGSGRLVFSRSEKAEEPWRDVDVRLTGPVVQDTVNAFRRNWESLTGEIIPLSNHPRTWTDTKGTTPVRFIQHRPDEEGDQNTRNAHLQSIRSAQDSITIENAYFLPPSDLRNALINAAHRGVKVRVMTNSRESNDIGIVSDAARYFYDDLVAAGVEIYEKSGGTLHSKTMTVDGTYSIVGSVNLNGRSQWRDSESMAAISSESTAKTLEKRFESGLTECKRITGQELEDESLITNLQQWAISFLAPTF